MTDTSTISPPDTVVGEAGCEVCGDPKDGRADEAMPFCTRHRDEAIRSVVADDDFKAERDAAVGL